MTDDKKNINLMPEDLRIKESDVLAKKQDNFQIDLIVPASQAKAKSVKSGQSWWQKLFQSFKKQPHFIEPVKAPHDKKPDTHKKDLNLNFDKYKQTKAPKIEEVYHKDIKDGQPEAVKPLPMSDNTKDSFFVKGLPDDRKNNWQDKSVVDKAPKQEVTADIFKEPDSVETMPTPPVVAPVAPLESPKTIDFSIPELASEKKKPKTEPPKKEDKPIKENKFHQPVAGISNRFINNGGGVDLIPMAVKTRSWRQISMLLVLSIVGSVFIVGIFYGALFFQGRNIANQEAAKALQISDLEKQILNYEDLNKEIKDLGSNITLVHDALNKHIYWTNFFALLEKYTISDVYYKGITAGNDGALTLRAVAKDFPAIARQLKVLEQESAKEFVTEAKVTAADSKESGVEFEITLVLNPNLFYYNGQPITATSTGGTN